MISLEIFKISQILKKESPSFGYTDFLSPSGLCWGFLFSLNYPLIFETWQNQLSKTSLGSKTLLTLRREPLTPSSHQVSASTGHCDIGKAEGSLPTVLGFLAPIAFSKCLFYCMEHWLARLQCHQECMRADEKSLVQTLPNPTLCHLFWQIKIIMSEDFK